jgi:hypothetical protein
MTDIYPLLKCVRGCASDEQFQQLSINVEKLMAEQRASIMQAMRTKQVQLLEYQATLTDRDDESGKHALVITEGRLLQLDQDMALIDLQPATRIEH